ncbi:MAG: hypothetical protein ACLFPS_09380 [Clostridia bacterium]
MFRGKLKIVFIMILLVFILLLIIPKELETGKYVSEDGLSFVIIEENDNIIFQRSAGTSYRPYGKYQLKGNRLTLEVNDDLKYEFEVKNDTLIFVSSSLREGFLKPGTKYILSEN